MKDFYSKTFLVDADGVDCFGRMRLSRLLTLAQQVSAEHSDQLGLSYEALAQQGLFWALIRNRVSITRLPREGETVRMETWPMPTTRTAYPRSTVAYDAQGQELFRTMGLWVLMRFDSRDMVLPAKSGVTLEGTLRGLELSPPRSLAVRDLANQAQRTVRFTDLDCNGHMNNARYCQWIDDLMPAVFHREHTPVDVTLCYFNEAREGQTLSMGWEVDSEGSLLVDFHRNGEQSQRIFSARIRYENNIL